MCITNHFLLIIFIFYCQICVSLQVYLNNKIFDNMIADSVDSQGVTRYNGPPCKDNPCMNGGICVPKLNIAECHCHKQFTGHRCQEGRGQFEIQRVYYSWEGMLSNMAFSFIINLCILVLLFYSGIYGKWHFI